MEAYFTLSQAHFGSSNNVRRDHGLTRTAKKTVTVASRCCPSKRTILSFSSIMTIGPKNNGRVRFLNQLAPPKSEVEYLKPHADEESRLRAVILSDYPYHKPSSRSLCTRA
jgi:hypothetical protein